MREAQMSPYAHAKPLAGAVLAVLILSGCGSAATPSPSPTATPEATPQPTEAAPSVAESASPSAATEQVYVVQKGDTLIRIAYRHGITLAALRAANPKVTDPTKLRVGQKLVIPAP